MKIEIRTRELKNGNKTIYLDFYDKGKRWYEYPKLYLVPESAPYAKEQNKNAMDKAIAIKAKRMMGEEPNVNTEGNEPDEKEVLVSEWMDEYIQKKKTETGLSSSYIKHIETVVRIAKDYLAYIKKPSLTMDCLDRDFMKGFLYYMTNIHECSCTGGKHKKLSQSTAHLLQFKMNTMLKQAEREGIIQCNPFQLLAENERIKKPASNRDFLTHNEIKAFMQARTLSVKTKEAFLFCCFTGLRHSDLIQLRWRNIEKSTSGITIRIDAMEKTGRPASIPLGENAIAWMPERGEKTLDELVFDIASCSSCDASLKRIAKRVGIDKKVSFHTSRHTFATLTLAATKDLATVSRLLGHASVTTTQIYAEVLMEDKVAAVNKLDSIFH